MSGTDAERIEPDYFTLNEAARYIGMSDTFIRESTKSGILKAIAVQKTMVRQNVGIRDGVTAIAREELESFIQHPSFKKSKRLKELRRGIV